MKLPEHRYSIAINLSFVSKSGKHTPGIGYFWSGSAQAMKRGLEILGIALVTDSREAYATRTVQTLLQRIRRVRRPKCVAHIERDSLVNHYLKALYDFRYQLLQLSNIIAADAFFSKVALVQGVWKAI